MKLTEALTYISLVVFIAGIVFSSPVIIVCSIIVAFLTLILGGKS